MKSVVRAVWLLFFVHGTTLAQSGPGVGDVSQATFDEILVTGDQPGPGLWKLTKTFPDGEHVLWVLGSHTPLPKKISWRSHNVEAVIAESQEVLTNSSVDANIGFFKSVTLLPSLIGVRNSPNDEKLNEVIEPEVYARWLVLKEKYIGRDNGVEKWRPIFAAQELYSNALKKADLSSENIVWPVVEKAAKKHKLKITTPKIEIEIDKPRAAIKEFKKSSLADAECFAKTIERLETDLDVMRARANAWATGNVKKLREMTHVDQMTACIAAVMNAQMVHERGYDDLPDRMATAWLHSAEAALIKNKSTFTVLSIGEIYKADGLVAKLQARGYVLDEP